LTSLLKAVSELELKGVSRWDEDAYTLEKLVAQVRAEYVNAGVHDFVGSFLCFLNFQTVGPDVETFSDKQGWGICFLQKKKRS
jgi:hypothetical protein